MQNYTDYIITSAGAAVSGASITVKDGGTSNVSTIYSDDGSTTTSNPLTSDSNGKFNFYAADGSYDLTITYGVTTATITGLILFDPYTANTADATINARTVKATIELKAPTAAPASPVAGDIWSNSGVLTFGASSKALASLSTAQSFTAAQTFTVPIISTVATGSAPFTVASTTAVTNLCADTGDSATSFFSAGNLELARLPLGTANQVLGTNSGATAQEHKTLSVGTTGTDFAVAHSANAIALNLPDAGASARGAVTTGTQTFAGAKTFTGIVTPTGGLAITGRSIFETVPIGSVAYGSFGAAVNPVAGTLYVAEIFIPRNFTCTGIAILTAGTIGTNKVIVGLHTTAGGADVAHSNLSGTALAGTNAFQLIPFTGTYAAVGPARFWVVAQYDGATDNVRMIATATFVSTFTKSTAGAFGTISSLTPPTSFTASVGPIAYIY